MSDFNFLKIFTENLQYKLNHADNNSNLTFRLFPDTGKFKKAYMNLDVDNRKFSKIKPINGVCYLSGSEITPTQSGALVAAITIRTEILIPCKENEQTRQNVATTDPAYQEGGNEDFLDQIRRVVETFTTKQEFDDDMEIANKTYSVAYAYELLNTGSRASRGLAGDSLVYSFNAYINVIEAGENSRADVYYLDGQIIPYSLAYFLTKTNYELDVYNGDYKAKATAGSNTFTVKFNFPSFVSVFNDSIKKYLVGDEQPNTVHVLTRVFGKYTGGSAVTKSYLVQFDNSDSAAQGVSNIGLTATFIPANDDYEVMKLPSVYTDWSETVGVTTVSSPITLGKEEDDNYYINSDAPISFIFFNREADTYVIGTCSRQATNTRYYCDTPITLSATQTNNILFFTDCRSINYIGESDR